jgi:hypothetical protein
VQGVQCTQTELEIVMSKIPEGVNVDDEMVGEVDGLK